MKLADRPRVEPLYKSDNLVIPCVKGSVSLLCEIVEELGQIDHNKDYVVTITPEKRTRTLTANAYYWQLTKKILVKLNKGKVSMTETELHNRNLAQVGIPWADSDGHRQWVLLKDNDWWKKQKEVHFCPTDRTEDRNGVVYRWFYLLLPSHLMDRSEMSQLIDYVVEDARSLGIETLPPDELERLKALWGGKT